MWIVGIIALFLVACLLITVIARRSPTMEKRPIWDIPRVAGSYTSIVGTLAGFVIASSFFLANQSRNTGVSQLETVIGMLIIGFLILIGTAMMYGTTPNAPASHTGDETFVLIQKMIYLLANINYFVGIALAWLSLRPLTVAIGAYTLAAILTWLLLFFVFAGAMRVGMHFYVLTGTSRIHTAFLLIIGFGLPSLYRLVLVPVWPMLWPVLFPSLSFAVIAFILASVGFICSSLLVHRLANPHATTGRLHSSDRYLLLYIQAVTCAIMLQWYSVALP